MLPPMRREGFPPDDPQLLSVNNAEAPTHALPVQAHYLGCPDSTERL
jgi:hypothetical protein